MTDPMQQARELLPCPFCGGEAERIDFGPGDAENEGGSCIACRRCQASGPVEFGFKENFIANWNRRAALRAAPEGSGVVNQSLTTGWKPIETAPKDGEIILIADIDDHHVMVRESRWEEATGKWSWPWICGLTPKLWMPIPPLAARPQGVKDA